MHVVQVNLFFHDSLAVLLHALYTSLSICANIGLFHTAQFTLYCKNQNSLIQHRILLYFVPERHCANIAKVECYYIYCKKAINVKTAVSTHLTIATTNCVLYHDQTARKKRYFQAEKFLYSQIVRGNSALREVIKSCALPKSRR